MLPGGHGLVTPYCYRAVVERFLDQEIASVIVASTTARQRDGTRRTEYSFADQASHAKAVAAFASKLAAVDRGRLVVWGHSQVALARS